MKFSSILKKVAMALTGLGLVGFLVTHLAGNFLLFQGPDKFNAYSRFLEENPFLIPAEIGLLALFFSHIYSAVLLTFENNAARPQRYFQRQTAGQSTLASRTMWLTGLGIGIFVVVHVWQFKFGNRPKTLMGSEGSLWQLVIDEFQKPGVVVFYVLCMTLLGLHLSHAIGSAFQSLGLRNHSGHPRLKGVGPAIGWGLAIGFAVLPLWAYIIKPKAPFLHAQENPTRPLPQTVPPTLDTKSVLESSAPPPSAPLVDGENIGGAAFIELKTTTAAQTE